MRYCLHLSRHVDRFGKPFAPAVPAMLCGHLDSDSGAIVSPDAAAVRSALPHYWRKAFDRAGSFWFPKDGNGAAHVALHDSRGRYRNTVYAIPCA